MTILDLIVEVLSWLFILSGCIFLLIGAVGTLRFPDFWSRMHAVSVTDSGGMILLTAGLVLQAGLTLITVKLLLIGVFLFITGPTATHAVANAALVSRFLPKVKKLPDLRKSDLAPSGTVAPKAKTRRKAKDKN